jgi:hypothetical protein
MIHRTYFVVMPTFTGVTDATNRHNPDPRYAAEVYLDIIVEGVILPGTPPAPLGQGGPIGGRPGGGGPLLQPVYNNTDPGVNPPHTNADSPGLALYLNNLGVPWTQYIQAPAGWYGHPEGGYYELRSRIVSLPNKFGAGVAPAANYVHRGELGWTLSIVPGHPSDASSVTGPTRIRPGRSPVIRTATATTNPTIAILPTTPAPTVTPTASRTPVTWTPTATACPMTATRARIRTATAWAIQASRRTPAR